MKSVHINGREEDKLQKKPHFVENKIDIMQHALKML
jgi:hypothetical protein